LTEGLRMAKVAHGHLSGSQSSRMGLVEFIVFLFSHSPSFSAISVISKT
jgi:hypothetical protein